MKKLLLVLLFLCPRPAFSAWTLIQQAQALSTDNSNVGPTTGVDTTNANALMVFLVSNTAINCTFADNKSNSWTLRDNQMTASGLVIRFYDVLPTGTSTPVVGSGHTVSCTGGSGAAYPAISFMAWKTPPAVVAFNGSNATETNTGTSLATGSITPTGNDALVLAGAGAAGLPQDVTMVSAGFTLYHAAATANAFPIGFAYLNQVTAAAVNPTFTLSASTTNGWADIVAYIPTGPKKGSLLTLGVGR